MADPATPEMPEPTTPEDVMKRLKGLTQGAPPSAPTPPDPGPTTPEDVMKRLKGLQAPAAPPPAPTTTAPETTFQAVKRLAGTTGETIERIVDPLLPHTYGDLATLATIYAITRNPALAEEGMAATRAVSPALKLARQYVPALETPLAYLAQKGVLPGLARMGVTGATAGGVAAATGSERPGTEAAKGAFAAAITPLPQRVSEALMSWYGSKRVIEQSTDWLANRFISKAPKLVDGTPLWTPEATPRQVLADVMQGTGIKRLQTDVAEQMSRIQSPIAFNDEVAARTAGLGGQVAGTPGQPKGTPFADLWQQADTIKDFKVRDRVKAVLRAGLAKVDPDAANAEQRALAQMGDLKAWQRWLIGPEAAKGKEGQMKAAKAMTDKAGNLSAEGVARVGQLLSATTREDAARMGLDLSDAPFWQPGMGAARAVPGEALGLSVHPGFPPGGRIHPGTFTYAPGWAQQYPAQWRDIMSQVAPPLGAITLGEHLTPFLPKVSAMLPAPPREGYTSIPPMTIPPPTVEPTR